MPLSCPVSGRSCIQTKSSHPLLINNSYGQEEYYLFSLYVLILCIGGLQAWWRASSVHVQSLQNVLCQLNKLLQTLPTAKPCSVSTTSFPFALLPSEKPYFQGASSSLPKTFAVSLLAVASQCKDRLPSPPTTTTLQPGNASLLPRHFPSSHLPWRLSCLCQTKTDSEAHSVFPSHYSSTSSTSAETHLPH